jgi:hypothetical protein
MGGFLLCALAVKVGTIAYVLLSPTAGSDKK